MTVGPPSQGIGVQPTDFSRSYHARSAPPDLEDTRKPGHMKWGNWARILLDARCVLTDGKSGISDAFFLIAPCRTEWMYRDGLLFQVPSREYRVLWSRDRHLSMGRAITYLGEPSSEDVAARFSSLTFTIQPLPRARILDTDEEVIRAVKERLPIVARTEIWNPERQMRAMIEYPVRTISFHSKRKRFQVDTGPVALPDLDSTREHWIEWFSMAHIVYNRFDRAEFIVRRPTPVPEAGKEVCTVLHYSERQIHEARHTIICGENK